MSRVSSKPRRVLVVALVAAVLLGAILAPAANAAPASAPAYSGGYWYTVQPGDTWARLSQRTGLSIGTLQAANPAHIHPPYNWLYVGHVLWIPAGPPPPPPPPPGCDYWYTVQYGDSWSVISSRTGVSISALQAANPSKVRPPSYWLYAGEKLYIPCGYHPPYPSPGYWYTVQPGDTWYGVAAKTGRSVAQLQGANPAHIHPPYHWLYIGHKLWIP